MKIIFTNCDFVLNHTRIIPFDCEDSPYFGRMFNAGVKELEIFNAIGYVPTGVLNIGSYCYEDGGVLGISNVQLREGTTDLLSVNFTSFTPTIDWTLDAITEHTVTSGNYTIRIKANFKAIKDAINTVPALAGSTIRGTEQNGCFNWRVD